MDTTTPTREDASSSYQPPRFDVISLDCEISAYAPDTDGAPDGDSLPLF